MVNNHKVCELKLVNNHKVCELQIYNYKEKPPGLYLLRIGPTSHLGSIHKHIRIAEQLSRYSYTFRYDQTSSCYDSDLSYKLSLFSVVIVYSSITVW